MFIKSFVLPTLMALGLVVHSLPASAQTAITPGEARAIARDAYIYGVPLVENYKTMYAWSIDKKGKEFKAPFNTLNNETRIFTPEDKDVVTPNPDILQSFLWIDLRAEPLVLEVPGIVDGRYYSIQLIDMNTFNFGYIGSRTTGNAAGRYMIAGPNWQGEKPEGVNKVIRSETDFVLAIYRTQLLGPDDLDQVKSIQGQYRVQTLNAMLGTPPPKPSPRIDFPKINPKSETGPGFFSYLSFLLQCCSIDPTETELMARFARIGVVPGKAFDVSKLSPQMRKALENGIKDGEEAINTELPKAKAVEIYGTRAYLKNDYLKRAVAARVGLYGNSREEIMNSLYVTDAEGKPLDASQSNYVLNLSGGNLPPVNAFWSITMYDAKTKSLLPNQTNRYLINSVMLKDLKPGADGGLTVYIQHESPGQDKEVNWLPAPDGPFYMVMRLYWPKPEAWEGAWNAPLVWSETKKQEQPVSVLSAAEPTQEVKPAVLVEEPKPELERPSVWGEPTEVRILIYVIDVDEVSSADQNFAASVFYEARWNNPFLRHKGPGPLLRGLTEVWNPHLAIIGQQMAWPAFPNSVEIQPDGEVIYRQKVWGRFSQPLDLRDFPLDRQTLTIHLAAAGLLEEHVKMVPLEREHGRASRIASKFSVPDFTVLSWKAEPMPYFPIEGAAGTAGFQMQIEVARSVSYFIWKVIVPLCLIVIMSWLPRWIDPEQIGSNIGISTTAFLTLVAYLFAITVLLPRVSYITRMDRFILLSTFMVFTGLMQTVTNTAMIRSGKKALVEKTDRWSRLVYPMLLLGVLGGSFML
jgi:hypothetical protein